MANIIEHREYIIESRDGYIYRLHTDEEAGFQIYYEEYRDGSYVEVAHIGIPFQEYLQGFIDVMTKEKKYLANE